MTDSQKHKQWRKNVRDRLLDIVRSSRLTNEKFAARCGVDAPRVTEWLKGRQLPNAESLCRIVEATRVSLDWLLFSGDTESEKGPVYLGQWREPATLEADLSAAVARGIPPELAELVEVSPEIGRNIIALAVEGAIAEALTLKAGLEKGQVGQLARSRVLTQTIANVERFVRPSQASREAIRILGMAGGRFETAAAADQANDAPLGGRYVTVRALDALTRSAYFGAQRMEESRKQLATELQLRRDGFVRLSSYASRLLDQTRESKPIPARAPNGEKRAAKTRHGKGGSRKRNTSQIGLSPASQIGGLSPGMISPKRP